MIFPPILEPLHQFVRGIVVQHVQIELSLMREPRQRQIAAAEKTDDRVDWIAAEKQVKLGV